MRPSNTTYTTSVITNDEPVLDSAYARSAADPPVTTSAMSRPMPSTVLAIEARRRRRWYLVDLSSFTCLAPRKRGAPTLIQLNRDELGDPRFLHGHAVQPVGNLHRPPVVRDENELGAVEHAAKHF